jgi:hypothetical protein
MEIIIQQKLERIFTFNAGKILVANYVFFALFRAKLFKAATLLN